MPRKLIGEILRDNDAVTEDQIAEALERQTMSDRALGHILFDMGLVTDDDILNAWSKQLGAEIVDLAEIEPSPDALERLPREIAEQHHVFPIRVDGDTLVLAMSDPLDAETFDEIASICKCSIETVVGSALGITQAISRHYDK